MIGIRLQDNGAFFAVCHALPSVFVTTVWPVELFETLPSLINVHLCSRSRLHKSWSYDLTPRRAFILTCTSGVTSLDARRPYTRRWSGLHQLDVSDFRMQIMSHNCMNSKFACFGLPTNSFESAADAKAKIAKSPERFMCHLIDFSEQNTFVA